MTNELLQILEPFIVNLKSLLENNDSLELTKPLTYEGGLLRKVQKTSEI